MILGHNDPGIREAVIKAGENGLSFGGATEKEVEMAELIAKLIPHWNDPYGKFRNRSGDECHPWREDLPEKIRSSNLQDAITDTATAFW